MAERKLITHPFNNFIETGLRMMALLNAAHPTSLDLQTLLYLDYLTVHSGDVVNGLRSLHPDLPSRRGEILVRRELIDNSLDVFEAKGLIVKTFSDSGITYGATEDTTPFLENLSDEYSRELNVRAKWVVTQFLKMSPKELDAFMNKFISARSENFDFNFLSNG